MENIMKITTLIVVLTLLSGCSMTPVQRYAFGQAMYEAGQEMQRQDQVWQNQQVPMPQTTTTSCRQNGSQVWCSSSTF